MVPPLVDERIHLPKDGVPSTFSEQTHCVLHIGMFHVLRGIIGYVCVVCVFLREVLVVLLSVLARVEASVNRKQMQQIHKHYR